MTLHDLVGYPLLAVSLLEILLGVVLLRRGGGDRVRRAAALFSFTLAAYTMAVGGAYVSWTHSAAAPVIYRFAWLGWLGIPAALHLLHALHGARSLRARAIVGGLTLFWIVAIVLVLATDLVETPPPRLIPFVEREAPLERVFRVLGSVQLVYVIAVIVQVHRRSRGQERLRLAYLLLGMLIVGIGAGVIAALLPLLSVPAVDPALGSLFALPSVGLTFVAITRHRLFDVATLVSRTLALAVLLLVLGAVHVGLFVALREVLAPTGAVALSFAITASALLVTPLRQWLQAGMDSLVRPGRERHHTLLHESARALVTILDPEELMLHLGTLVSGGLGAASVAVYATVDETTLALRRVVGVDAAGYPNVLSAPQVATIRAAGRPLVPLPCTAALGCHIHDPCVSSNRCQGLLALPLQYQDAIHGMVFVAPRADGAAYVEEDYAVLEALGSQAAVALANAHLYREATTDDLTGLTHRKHFLRRVEEEQVRARLADRSLAVLMLDIDRFKPINDTWGHPVGDRVLKGVAWSLQRVVRHPDVAARWGGEEFAVLLCGVNLATAQRVAERIREAIAAERYARGTSVTISIGVAVQRPAFDPAPVADIVAAADSALYAAKRSGRNRVCTAPGIPPGAAGSAEVPRFTPSEVTIPDR